MGVLECLLRHRLSSRVSKAKLFFTLLLAAGIFYLLNSRRSYYFVPDNRPLFGSLARRYPDSIPPIVHWTSKNGQVAAKLVKIVSTWRKLIDVNVTLANVNRTTANYSSIIDGFQPNRWSFMHWDDDAIGDLISRHYPNLVRSYGRLVNGLERSDIGRLVVLHHVGGLYVDTDVELLRDPSPMLQPSQLLDNSTLLTANFSCRAALWSQEPREHAVFLFKISSMISNAVMMSQANHSFLSYVLGQWPNWFESSKWWKRPFRNVNDAVFVTGPLMLQEFYEKYKSLPPKDRPDGWCGNLLARADTFQPLWDVVFQPDIVKKACAKPGQLMPLQKIECGRLIARKFTTRDIPNSSYTVHRFMHVSYKFGSATASKPIDSILPILSCKP